MTGRDVLRIAYGAERRRMIGSAVLIGAHQGFEALVPVVMGATLDEAIEPSDGGALVLWLVMLVVLFAALSSAFRIGARIGIGAMERVAHALRLRLVERVLDPRGGGDGGRGSGELLSVATADVDAVAKAVRGVAMGTGVVVALLAGAVVLLLTSVQLGLVVIAALPAVVFSVNRLGRPLSRRAGSEQERAAEAAGVATDLVGGLRTLQGIGGVPAGVARYRAASARSLRGALSAARSEAVFESSAVLVSGIVLAVVALVGGRLAANGDVSIGQLIAAAGVTQFLVGPLGRLGNVAAVFARARASADRLATALSAPPAVTGSGAADGVTPLDATGPSLTVTELRHGPLTGLDVDVTPGTVHGIAAADPAAAAALLDCLAREAEPEAGSIAAGHAAMLQIDPEAARALVAVIPHDAPLLADTVRANVAAAAASDEAVQDAIAAAAVDEMAYALEDGLDTQLSDAGRSLSGGQRQRVLLARALATRAPVLVLHDPTTALDAATESAVAGALARVRGERTTVLVTTSPALLNACHAVTVVRDGRAQRTATHGELAASDEAYRELVLG